jgi:phage tail-like protein
MNNNESFYELNYVTANRFYVEIGSDIKACFSECSGLGITIDKDVYLEGGVNNQQRIFLKQSKFSDVTLKRGMTNDIIFWEWISQVLNSSTTPQKRLSVNILLFNQGGETMQTWTLHGAIPVAWKAPSLQANSNTMAIEELTLAYESVNISPKKDYVKTRIIGEQRDNQGFFPNNTQSQR